MNPVPSALNNHHENINPQDVPLGFWKKYGKIISYSASIGAQPFNQLIRSLYPVQHKHKSFQRRVSRQATRHPSLCPLLFSMYPRIFTLRDAKHSIKRRQLHHCCRSTARTVHAKLSSLGIPSGLRSLPSRLINYANLITSLENDTD